MNESSAPMGLKVLPPVLSPPLIFPVTVSPAPNFTLNSTDFSDSTCDPSSSAHLTLNMSNCSSLTEDASDWEKYFEELGATQDMITLAMYSVVFCASVLGNVLVGLTILASRHLRTLTNVLLFNLCVSDLLIGAQYFLDAIIH